MILSSTGFWQSMVKVRAFFLAGPLAAFLAKMGAIVSGAATERDRVCPCAWLWPRRRSATLRRTSCGPQHMAYEDPQHGWDIPIFYGRFVCTELGGRQVNAPQCDDMTQRANPVARVIKGEEG